MSFVYLYSRHCCPLTMKACLLARKRRDDYKFNLLSSNYKKPFGRQKKSSNDFRQLDRNCRKSKGGGNSPSNQITHSTEAQTTAGEEDKLVE